MTELQTNVLALRDLGQMPSEVIVDEAGYEEKIRRFEEYDKLLSGVKRPVTLEEAAVLIRLFPEETYYDLEWDLLRLIEDVLVSDTETYEVLIQQCPSQEWRETLLIRHENWKKKQGS